MKKLFLSMIAMATSLVGYAQVTDAVTATLQAGETTTVYYGYDAFKDAIAAAPTDVVGIITLSPGAFNNPGNISKSVKIYGAGFQDDTANNISATSVTGDLNIVSTTEVSPTVRIEGVKFVNNCVLKGPQTITGTEIVKCGFGTFFNRVATDNTIIRQSYFSGDISGDNKIATHFLISNCYFFRIADFSAGSDVAVNHCILASTWNPHGPYFYYGNIIHPYYSYDSHRISAGATCQYNVSSDAKLSNDGNNSVTGNYDKSQWKDFQTLFADGQDNLDYLDASGNPRTWTLAAPSTYVDLEGTPCGVTGGNYPWNPTPATPRITSTTVDAKTVPGTLKVSITAVAGSAD